jgi:hypothetical protein
MHEITFKEILAFLQRAVYSVDRRLPNHGEQVAYLAWATSWQLGFRDERLLRLMASAMLHDIGACDPEERQRISDFELLQPLDHCVTGYLLLRDLGPDPEMARFILYHHHRWDVHARTAIRGIPYAEESAILHLADRMAILFSQSGQEFPERVSRFFERTADEGLFNPDHVRPFLQLALETDLLDKLVSGDYLSEIYGMLNTVPLREREIKGYLWMLAGLVDFRHSRLTGHTEAVLAMVRQLLEWQGIADPETLWIVEQAILIRNAGRLALPPETYCWELNADSGERLTAVIRQIDRNNADIVAGLPGLEANGFGIAERLQRTIALADIVVSLMEAGMESGQVFVMLSQLASMEFFDEAECGLMKNRLEMVLPQIDKARTEALVKNYTIVEDHRSLSQRIRLQF